MFRALFLAIGIVIAVVGAECLVIEKAVFAGFGPRQQEQQVDPFGFVTQTAPQPRTREVVPPDWAPWGLLAGGAIVIIYSFTIPRRMNG